MRRMIGLGFVIVTVSLIASTAHSQFGKMAAPRFYSEFKPVIGGWSEYQITTSAESTSKMKLAIVEKEGDAYWYETVFEGKQEGKIITKMLVSGNPGDQNNVKRVIFKMGNEAAMEMPFQMMQQGSQPLEPKGKTVDKGTETIKVPAGTFTSQHMQHQDGETIVDVWVVKDVSPYGVVKSQSKEFGMVLLGYGTGAKTLITETPRKFEMPQMRRGGTSKSRRPGKGQAQEDDSE